MAVVELLIKLIPGAAMTRDETIALFLECEAKREKALATALSHGRSELDAHLSGHEIAKQHWNSWANGMLTKRKQLEASNRWEAEVNNGNPLPKKAETQAWMAEAEADFSHCLFLLPTSEANKQTPEEVKENTPVKEPPKIVVIRGLYIDLTGFVFPGDASFESAVFSGGGVFCDANFLGNASFAGSTFSGSASFERATFSRITRFHDVKFSGSACFDDVMFLGSVLFAYDGTTRVVFDNWASFKSARFGDRARFDGVAFSEKAFFDNVTFLGEVWFQKATFSGHAHFLNATCKDLARFEGAIFSRITRFDNATFSGDACFEDAAFYGPAYFENASFSKGTSFRDAKFTGDGADFTGIRVERAFDLKRTHFWEVPNFSQADFKQAPDLDSVKFRLPSYWPWKRGKPFLIPMYRALRRMAIQGADYDREHRAFKGELRSRRWIEDKPWHPALWFGILYDFAADCGRSIGRPFAIWLVSVFVFAVLYLPTGKNALDSCVTGNGSLFWRSLYISGRNALVLSSGGKDDRITQAYRCLFGSADGILNIPLGVSFIEAFVQVPLSAVLIFLILLAVKNRFKIK